ncbi:hypothetical protein KG088_11545 [Halomonas sp. TRM85114]|uniref:hypothetical protein n=1 Tax=Halomonas jincaotanensis TaxID=2810616 RepID=UPI001BD309B8|nr:hypothetical protein [Halomonas jincaotanensis]MBS9404265.1 hypothetical protein [Halomonas jincaotanensis]
MLLASLALQIHWGLAPVVEGLERLTGRRGLGLATRSPFLGDHIRHLSRVDRAIARPGLPDHLLF